MQGPLADALEWMGVTTDDFNKKLADCTTEQERATLITNTLNGMYAGAAAEYNELTASTQEARRATAEMEETQADIGAMLEPLTTAWMNLKAQALEAIIPVIQSVLDAFRQLGEWMEENPQKAEILKGVLLGIVTALSALAVALGISSLIQTVTTAFKALNAVMVANPIGIIIAVLAGLVAAFIYLWNNCDAFREFWIDLWGQIKETAAAVATWFSETWASVSEWAITAWASFSEFWANLWEGVTEWLRSAVDSIVEFFTVTIPGAIDSVKQWFAGLVDTFVEFATVTVPGFIDDVVKWFTQLPERMAYALGYAIGTIIQFGIDLWEFATVDVPAFIAEVVRWFSELPDVIWGWLSETLSNIAKWVVNTTNKAIEAGTNFLNKIVEFFSQLPGKVWEWLNNTILKLSEFVTNATAKATEAATGIFDSIIDGVKELPGEMLSIGEDIVDGIWEGISSGWDWLTSQVKSLATSLFDGVKAALKINSPSKKFAWIGEMTAKGQGVGYEDEMDNVEKDMKSRIADMTARVQASVAAENTRVGQSMGAPDTGLSDLARAVGTQTVGINSLAGEYRRGSNNMRPIILQLDKREVGRAFVDVFNTETTRVGLSMGGA